MKLLKDAEYLIISTPANYDYEKNYFNTRMVEAVIANVLSINPDAVMINKSTVPFGYTESVKEKFDTKNIIFCPVFLLYHLQQELPILIGCLLWRNIG